MTDLGSIVLFVFGAAFAVAGFRHHRMWQRRALAQVNHFIENSLEWERHYATRADEYAAFPDPEIAKLGDRLYALASKEREHRARLEHQRDWLERWL